MRTITAKTKAWLSEFHKLHELQDPQRAVETLSFISLDMSGMRYMYIGEAEITVHILDEDRLVTSKVESLRAQVTAVRAAAEAKCTEIEGEIQKLLAISYEPAAEAPAQEGSAL